MNNIEDWLRSILQQQGRGEREWTDGDGDNDGGWGRGGGREMPRIPRIPKIPLILIGALLLLLSGFTGIVDFYADLLWYRSLGFSSVLWGRILPQVGCFLAFGVAAFLFFRYHWRRAVRIGTDEFRAATGQADATLVPPLYVTGFAALMAFMSAAGNRLDWMVLLRFLHRVPFGETDAIFGRDVAWYVFTLPFVQSLQGWLQGIVMTALMGTGIVYLLCRALRSEGNRIVLVKPARLHLFALGSLLLFLFGLRLWLSRYGLLHSPDGIVHGVGYTDFHVRLPALTLLSVAVLAAAVLLLANFFRPMWKASGALVAALLVLGFLAQGVVPPLVQNYIVKPNEYEREKPFLEHHIAATRRAFGLDRVRTFQMTPAPEVTRADLYEDTETVENIRLWDYAPLLRTYKQLQEIRTYYEFGDVDIDRYRIDGKNRQVMLSLRELDTAQIQNRTWVNAHLEFTHGYGVVMNPVNEMEESGLPVFFMKDLPPKSTVPIRIDRPEIYYGEKPSTYALVRTNVKEFDYPMGDSNVRSTYEGSGGVPIGGVLRKLLFAFHFRDSEIFFTNALTPESRILVRRNVREAVSRIAPFLILDEDMYPVISGGRILWVQDAYTASGAYPYARPLPRASATQAGLREYVGVNYIRNSVKVVIDAYDGSMRFYLVDPDDPIARTWARAFPALFTPAAEVPDEIRAHFRYPEEFFEVQSEMYRIYHMTDTNTYYNREDVWMTTPQGRERRIRPNYVTMQLLDEREPEFTLIAPFLPQGRNNLIGWMAGRCDGAHYGELVVYQFPKQELVFGPPQIEALIDQNTVISSQISLWSQHGSDVIRGDLLVIPVGGSLLYVQPLYLRAERGDLPELKRIILSTGGRVAWGETFEEAVTALFGAGDAGPAASASKPPETQPAVPTREAGEAQPAERALRDLAKDAKTHYEAAQRAARDGDWARYGDELERLGTVLERIETLTGAAEAEPRD